MGNKINILSKYISKEEEKKECHIYVRGEKGRYVIVWQEDEFLIPYTGEISYTDRTDEKKSQILAVIRALEMIHSSYLNIYIYSAIDSNKISKFKEDKNIQGKRIQDNISFRNLNLCDNLFVSNMLKIY